MSLKSGMDYAAITQALSRHQDLSRLGHKTCPICGTDFKQLGGRFAKIQYAILSQIRKELHQESVKDLQKYLDTNLKELRTIMDDIAKIV